MTRRGREWRIRLANRISGHVNHYDSEFPLDMPPTVLTVEWLDETEAKLREGLNDRFVDDACAVMLAMVGHCRRLLVAP